MVSGRAFDHKSEVRINILASGWNSLTAPAYYPRPEVTPMITLLQLLVAIIGVVVSAIGVVHTIRRDKRKDQEHENSRPGRTNLDG